MKTDEFIAHGQTVDCLFERLEIQISETGEAARWRRIYCVPPFDERTTTGNWQEIKYNSNAEPYITRNGKKLYLSRFYRMNNNPWL